MYSWQRRASTLKRAADIREHLATTGMTQVQAAAHFGISRSCLTWLLRATANDVTPKPLSLQVQARKVSWRLRAQGISDPTLHDFTQRGVGAYFNGAEQAQQKWMHAINSKVNVIHPSHRRI